MGSWAREEWARCTARGIRVCGREVALKVLPEAFAADAQRLGRLEREAKVLASLNHPNIGSIYGFEDSSGVHALVQSTDGRTSGLWLCVLRRRQF